MTRHPVTDEPFDFQHTCRTCVHFTDRERTSHGVKHRVTSCALDPEQRNLAELDGNTVWAAMPACSQHRKA